MTRNLFDFLVEVVIERQFLAGTDIAQAHVQDVSLDDARHQIRFAGVIDELRSRAARRAVDRPVLVERKQINKIARLRAPLSLAAADPLAGILDHLAAARNKLRRVYAPSMNAGRREFQLETGILSVDLWGLRFRWRSAPGTAPLRRWVLGGIWKSHCRQVTELMSRSPTLKEQLLDFPFDYFHQLPNGDGALV